MPKTITRLNMEHFRRRLAEETEPTTRQTLMRLMAEEEAKLTALENVPPNDEKK